MLWAGLFVAACFGNRCLLHSVFEALENAAWVLGCLFQGVEYAVTHLDGGLEGGLFAAVLTVREVLGELVLFAADTQAPTLEGCRFVRIPSDVALCHG